MWLGSSIAMGVAKASGAAADSTPSLGTSTCHRYDLKKKKKKEEKESFER